jgi:two-component system sensor histidine kinase KdpD
VGKTYAMLNEAQRRVKYGEDVVVGLVETHNRPNTAAQLIGLEVIPRRRVSYKGVTLEEMDVPAILGRHPAVCLVDEMAHTNAPGSDRQKRYEDIQVLLEAGIDVVATLNVQHLESLHDTVQSITGVAVRETLPDSVLDEADEVILIDLSPEGARARMEHGHIYPPEQAQQALQRFFRAENLGALRELALRRTAQEVDEQMEALMRDSHAQTALEEKVLDLVDEQPHSHSLIRRGWRLAQGLHAELLVACERRELGEAARLELAKTMELAEDLNARIISFDGGSTTEALYALVNVEHVGQIVLPRPQQTRFGGLFHASLGDQLMQRLPNVELHFA